MSTALSRDKQHAGFLIRALAHSGANREGGVASTPPPLCREGWRNGECRRELKFVLPEQFFQGLQMPFEFLKSVQLIRRSGGGGLEVAPPWACYRNTSVRRGLRHVILVRISNFLGKRVMTIGSLSFTSEKSASSPVSPPFHRRLDPLALGRRLVPAEVTSSPLLLALLVSGSAEQSPGAGLQVYRSAALSSCCCRVAARASSGRSYWYRSCESPLWLGAAVPAPSESSEVAIVARSCVV